MSNLSTKFEVYQCNKCFEIYKSQQRADKCCVKELIRNCTRCSKIIKDTYFQHRAKCDDCVEYERVLRECQMVKEPQKDKPLYIKYLDKYLDYTDHFKNDLLDLLDDENVDPEMLNGYVYLCKDAPIEINLDHIYSQLEDQYPDIEDFYGIVGLSKAVEEFNGLNKDRFYVPDYKSIYVYDSDLFSKWLKENSIEIDPLDYALGVTRKFKLKELGTDEKNN